METAVYMSPCGRIELRVRGGKLAQVKLMRPGRPADAGRRRSVAMAAFLRALAGYFRGSHMAVGPDELDLAGVSDFQRRVYLRLMEVPRGEVVSYGELAELAGMRGAARAVGQALGRNPLPIFVPCHRVVRKDGRPGGFGAGMEWKRCLLAREGWTV